jgi:Trypsin-like peptidase domain
VTKRLPTASFAALAVIAVAVATITSGCGTSRPAASAPKATSNPRFGQPTLADTVARVRSGVLRIETNLCDGEGQGTGFLLSPRLIATVQHVVDGASAITIKRNGEILTSATVIGADPDADVALLRTDAPISGFHFKLADRRPRLAEDVASIGFPLGLPLSVDRGTVSGSDRTVEIDGIKRTQLIQTDAALNPGNSGGPLISVTNGRVVGLVDLKNVEASGVGFAVSADVAQPLIDAWSLAPQPEPATDCSTPAVDPTEAATPSAEPAVGHVGGRYFTMTFPAFWSVETSDKNEGTYFDTTVVNQDDPAVLARVDVTPNLRQDLLAAAEVVRSALRRQTGYREISYTRTTIDGRPGIRWEFVVPEHGVRVRKVDRFFLSPTGAGFAVLTQAPESEYSTYEQPLGAIAETVTPN